MRNPKHFRKWLAPGAMALVVLTTAGFVAPQQHTESLSDNGIGVGIRVLRPTLVTSAAEGINAFGANVQVKADALSGAPRLITGDLLPGKTLNPASVGADGFVALAKRYITDHADVFGLRADDLSLNRQALLIDKDLQFVRFDVLRNGQVVRDADVQVRFQRGRLMQIVNHSYAEASIDAGAKRDDLGTVAKQATLAARVEVLGDAYRVQVRGNAYALVPVTEFRAHGQDDRPSIVSVAAVSGKVFEIRPTAFYLSGQAVGSVYPRTYFKASPTQLPYRNVRLIYSGGDVTTDDTGNFNNAPESAQPGLRGFAGTRVKVQPATGTPVVVTGRANSGHWEVVYTKGNDRAPEDKNMAQSMTYYHLTKEINHARKYINNSWLDEQLTANVNLSQSCNAYWDGSTVNLFSAGGGCANTALIADVFYHEWGHGLHANSGGIQDGAYSEGYADTLALMMTHSPIIGLGFKVADGAPVRDLTTLKVYPQDADTEIHKEGLIIGGAYYDLFKSLVATYGEDKAGDLLSNFALKSISTTARYTDVYDALLTIDGNDAERQSPNFCAINKAFARHGLATADTNCQ